MAIICPKLKLLFIMVPGTGCSVIGNALVEECDGHYVPETDLVVDGRVTHQSKHNTADQLLRDDLITPEQLEDLLVVATVRNPLDSFTTYYQRTIGDWTEYSHGVQARKIESDFEAGLITEDKAAVLKSNLERRKRYRAFRTRLLKIAGFGPWAVVNAGRTRWKSASLFSMLAHVDVAIRYEHLEKGLNTVLQRLGQDKPLALPHKNATHGKRPYQEYYSGLTRWLVCRMLKAELERFGYPDVSDESTVVLSDEKVKRFGW